jgi:hypothetical protein
MLLEEVMSESDFSLNGLLDRYSYSFSSYSSGNDSASSDRFEMNVGVSFNSSFNNSPTSNSSVGAYMNNNSILPDGGTYQDPFEVPAGITALLSFFYGSVSVMAVVGNCLVMWIVATSRRMQNVTNCFIANLALADIVIGLFVIPFQVSLFAGTNILAGHFFPHCLMIPSQANTLTHRANDLMLTKVRTKEAP